MPAAFEPQTRNAMLGLEPNMGRKEGRGEARRKVSQGAACPGAEESPVCRKLWIGCCSQTHWNECIHPTIDTSDLEGSGMPEG